MRPSAGTTCIPVDLLEPSLFFATTASHGVLAIDSAGGRGRGQHWQGAGRAATVDGEGTDMCCTMRRGESHHGSLCFSSLLKKTTGDSGEHRRRGKPARRLTTEVRRPAAQPQRSGRTVRWLVAPVRGIRISRSQRDILARSQPWKGRW